LKPGVFEQIQRRKLAYVNTFSKENQAAQEVLKDLARFCRAYESTFHPDQRVHAVLEGRREVYLRIREYLSLTSEEIMAFHKIKDITKE